MFQRGRMVPADTSKPRTRCLPSLIMTPSCGSVVRALVLSIWKMAVVSASRRSKSSHLAPISYASFFSGSAFAVLIARVRPSADGLNEVPYEK